MQRLYFIDVMVSQYFRKLHDFGEGWMSGKLVDGVLSGYRKCQGLAPQFEDLVSMCGMLVIGQVLLCD